MPDLATPFFDVVLERHIPSLNGTLRFESAKAGTLMENGEARRADHRAYHWIPDPVECRECGGTGRLFDRSAAGRRCPAGCVDGVLSKRVRLTSVTTLLSAISEKPGLVPWGENAGSRGTVRAIKLGLLDPFVEGAEDMAINVVRANRLGADAARDDAAARGLNSHALIQGFLEDGTVPSLGDHPEDQWGYIRALSSWLLAARPEPEATELMVCDPTAGYGGRLDLIARIDGKRTLVDFKTSEKGKLWEGGHFQLGLLERGMRVCGDGEVDRRVLVALAADGSFREMEGRVSPPAVEATLVYAGFAKEVRSACERANRVEREAARAAA